MPNKLSIIKITTERNYYKTNTWDCCCANPNGNAAVVAASVADAGDREVGFLYKYIRN
jgi:hypothetical protein